jgi:pimeloyl-ACP methyl ester carboxylesterase
VVTWGVLAVDAGVLLSSHARVEQPVDDAWSRQKRWVTLNGTPVALVERGRPDAPPVVLLHGCPFSSVIWRDVIDAFAQDHRVIAPDLLGLGDTRVGLSDDYRLPRDVELVLALLDELRVTRSDFVTTDHGGAVLQLLMARAPARIGRAVITNAEAYDAWPSAPERPYLEAVVNPISGPVFKALLGVQAVRRRVFSIAVADPRTLDDELLTAFVESHTASPERWQRLVRFYRWQLDPEHQAETMRSAGAVRAFDGQVLVLWGADDGNFGRAIAERLAGDLPNARLEWITGAGHLPMIERPAAYATAVTSFLGAKP